MKKQSIVILLLLIGSIAVAQTRFPRFKVLAFYSHKVEKEHVAFADDAIDFFKKLTVGNGFVFDTTSNFDALLDPKLAEYTMVMWLNDFPHTEEQRRAFEHYMENGGGWLGFHVSGYNDKDSHWPWFVDFMGGAVFHSNNYPPLPAKMIIEDPTDPVTRGLPPTYIAPRNEWYSWKPSPREDKDVKVLVTLSPDNYPLGIKDFITEEDTPIVWTNTKYRMVYMNYGHGYTVLTDPTQNKIIINAFLWLVSKDPTGNKLKD